MRPSPPSRRHSSARSKRRSAWPRRTTSRRAPAPSWRDARLSSPAASPRADRADHSVARGRGHAGGGLRLPREAREPLAAGRPLGRAGLDQQIERSRPHPRPARAAAHGHDDRGRHGAEPRDSWDRRALRRNDGARGMGAERGRRRHGRAPVCRRRARDAARPRAAGGGRPDLDETPLRRDPRTTRRAVRAMRASRQVELAVAAGVIFATPLLFAGKPWLYPLVAWDLVCAVYLVGVWRTIIRSTPEQTRDTAEPEDPSPAVADILLLGAAVASFAAVGVVLNQAHGKGGGAKDALTGMAVASMVLSWTTVHTVYTLQYARMYYDEKIGGAI